jgi:hypothetical protein
VKPSGWDASLEALEDAQSSDLAVSGCSLTSCLGRFGVMSKCASATINTMATPSFSYRGQWWLPGEEDVRWHGTLAFVDARLELDVDLPAHTDFFGRSADPQSIILGEATDGTMFTLVDSYARRTTTHLPGRARAIFRVRLAVVGAWFGDSDELHFDNVDVRLHLLDQWLDVSGFKFEYLGVREGFDLAYRVPETVDVAEFGNVTITAEFSGSSPGIVRPLVDLHFVQQARLKIVSASPVHLEEHEEFVRRIRNFLSFAARQDVPVLEMHGHTDVEMHAPDRAVTTESKRLRIVPGQEPEASGLEQAREILLMHGDAPEDGKSPLAAWLEHYDLIGPIFELYLVTLYQPRVYLHLQFLSLAQALESLHGRRFPDWEMPKAEFKARVTDILAAVPADVHGWLKQKLAQANQAPFRKRIEELVETLPPALRSLITDLEGFSRLVGYTRNYYTHWDPRLQQKAAQGEELIQLTFALKLVVEALLLLELGFSCDEVEIIVTRNPRFDQERRHFFNPPLTRS